MASGSALYTAALGGIFLAGLIFLDPVAGAAWEWRNQGRRLDDVDEEVALRRQLALRAMREAREARWRASADTEAEAARRVQRVQAARRLQELAHAVPLVAAPPPDAARGAERDPG